jgi:hypothetical protein
MDIVNCLDGSSKLSHGGVPCQMQDPQTEFCMQIMCKWKNATDWHFLPAPIALKGAMNVST